MDKGKQLEYFSVSSFRAGERITWFSIAVQP